MRTSLKRLLILSAILLVTASALFAGANREIPDLQVSTTGTQYLSPNGDGVKDTAELGFTVRLYVKSNEGYVPEYGLVITDAGGQTVNEVKQQEKSDVGWFLRLFRGYTEFTLDKTVKWDGTDDSGAAVSDGTYKVTMYVIDSSGNRQDADLDDFVVDTQAPSLSVTPPDALIFSPNDDDNLDTFVINQRSGTSEDLWSAQITDSTGTVVQSYTWRNGAPDTIAWDGTSSSGALLTDGVYGYSLTSTDRAGNVFTYSIDAFLLDTTPTTLTLAFDNDRFSPNGDGAKDTVTATLGYEVKEDIVSWVVSIADLDNERVRRFEGNGNPPASVTFDGKSDSGAALSEATYAVTYSLKYKNGNNPATSGLITLDTTPPVVSVDADTLYFSPNGDGSKDTLEAELISNEPVTWQATVKDSRGRTIFATTTEQTSSALTLSGKDASGKTLPEGTYTIQGVFTDLAGNRLVAPDAAVVIDLTDPVVTFALDKDVFSPNGDGRKDTVTAAFTSSEPVKGLLTLVDPNGRDTGTLGGYGKAYQYVSGSYSYDWGGIAGTGVYVPNNAYTVKSEFMDRAGNKVSAPDLPLEIDARDMNVELVMPRGFSPNGDGAGDELEIYVDAVMYDNVKEWNLEITDDAGKTIQVLAGTGIIPIELAWDGSLQHVMDTSVKAAEGRYRAKFYAEYDKGDIVDIRSGVFVLDITPPDVDVKMAADPFAKVNGGIEGDLFITLDVIDASEIGDWQLEIMTDEGESVRSFTGRGDPSDQVAWNGAPEPGKKATYEDMFDLKVTVTDEHGNMTSFVRPVPLDIIVVKKDGKLFLLVPNIIFGAYKHELDSRGPSMYKRNIDSINKVISIQRRYPQFDIGLEAHALNIYLGDSAKASEEEKILYPLTERRADTVRDALVDRGMDPDDIVSNAYGGKDPITPVDNLQERWKNRRVEFIMIPE